MKKACNYYLHFNSINKGIIVLYIRQVASMDGLPQKVLGYKRYISLVPLSISLCCQHVCTSICVLMSVIGQEVATITYKGRNTRGRSLVRKYGHTQLHKLQIHLDKPVSLNYYYFFLYDMGLGTGAEPQPRVGGL